MKPEKAVEDLKKLAKEVDDQGGIVVQLANHLIDQPIFQKCSGSPRPELHHYGDHGLVVHTSEVVRGCLHMANLYSRYKIDKTELYLAALYHDAGKTRDYHEIDNPEAPWGSTDHKRNIYHISRSVIIWTLALERLGISPKFREKYEDKVVHAILAHHGRREWGSPVGPNSRVAWLLHLCDNISARLCDVNTIDRGIQ
jgi:3'-5' exoribonuclease